MKKLILIIASILISNFGISQINPTDVSQAIESIDMAKDEKRHITWHTEIEEPLGHRIINSIDNTYAYLHIQSRHGSNDFHNSISITSKGYVGIGSDHPDELLTVKGTIHAEEIKVDLDVPADYVFQKYYNGFSTLKSDYSMLSLIELEAFIQANHHLPEVPSAKTIKEDGLHLKEMTNLLLQKVEELTLYTIEQEKRIKALEELLAKKQ